MLTPAMSVQSLWFENAWPIVVGLVIVWATLRLVGARLRGGERDEMGRRMRVASWGVLVVAVLVLAVEWYVVTPGERVESAMHELLAAVEEEDWDRFDELTAEDATGRYLGVEFTRAGIDNQLENVEVGDITLLSKDVAYFPQQNEAITSVRLRVRISGEWEGLEGIAGLDVSTWSIQWRQRADGSWEAFRFTHLGSGIDGEIE